MTVERQDDMSTTTENSLTDEAHPNTQVRGANGLLSVSLSTPIRIGPLTTITRFHTTVCSKVDNASAESIFRLTDRQIEFNDLTECKLCLSERTDDSENQIEYATSEPMSLVNSLTQSNNPDGESR